MSEIRNRIILWALLFMTSINCFAVSKTSEVIITYIPTGCKEIVNVSGFINLKHLQPQMIFDMVNSNLHLKLSLNGINVGSDSVLTENMEKLYYEFSGPSDFLYSKVSAKIFDGKNTTEVLFYFIPSFHNIELNEADQEILYRKCNDSLLVLPNFGKTSVVITSREDEKLIYREFFSQMEGNLLPYDRPKINLNKLPQGEYFLVIQSKFDEFSISLKIEQ